MKRKVNCGELPVEITLLGLPQMVKATSETCTRKGEFHLCAVFSTKALLRDGKRAKRDVKCDAKRDAWHNGNLK